MLTIRNLSKTFPGQVAVREVNLDLLAGEIHALCGQNGSGKSTIIKMLSGFHRPDPGAAISFLGEDVLHQQAAIRNRMHFIHQDLGLIDSLDAAENLALVETSARRSALSPIRRRRSHARASRALAALGVQLDVTVPVGTLSPVERSMIAIARAISGWTDGVGLLVLDEPTVSLSLREVQTLFSAIRRIREQGAAILYVSHRLEEIFELADRVSVLREGSLVLTEPTSDLTHDRLIEAIVGKSVHLGVAAQPRRSALRAGVSPPALSVRNLRAEELNGLSLDVGRGEILGVTGLVGSGMEVLTDVLFGARPFDSGTVCVLGNEVDHLSPNHAVRLGIAHVPAQRLLRGCIAIHTIRENLMLPELESVSRGLRIRPQLERTEAARWAAKVALQQGTLDRPLGMLSGGNQQKVVLARWLRLGPNVLLLHEPTQGVDIGARAMIHDLLRSAAANGLGTLAVSTDTEDLATYADRVTVLDRGRAVGEFSGAQLTSHALISCMLSASAAPQSEPLISPVTA